MGKEIYKLKVSVEILSFKNETNEYTYLQSSLDEIDKKTNMYINSQAFFNANRIYIEGRVKGDFEREHGFSPNGVNLGENGVYITKNVDGVELPIRPLFKRVVYEDKEYELSDIIKNKLYRGNIKYFYECDQFREALGGYDSFFNGLDHGILSRIVTEDYSSGDIVWLWDWIKDSKRICPLMRFLLMDLEHFEGNLNEYYYETIPAREKTNSTHRQSEERLYTYRPPYKDD